MSDDNNRSNAVSPPDEFTTVWVPLSQSREMRVTMTVLEEFPSGEVFIEKPTLEDFDAAALAMAGRNYAHSSGIDPAKTLMDPKEERGE